MRAANVIMPGINQNINVAGESDINPGWWNPLSTWPSWTQPAVTYNILQTPRCAWCQGTHTDKCPDLKSVTYRQDGTVERVEFFDRADS